MNVGEVFAVCPSWHIWLHVVQIKITIKVNLRLQLTSILSVPKSMTANWRLTGTESESWSDKLSGCCEQT